MKLVTTLSEPARGDLAPQLPTVLYVEDDPDNWAVAELNLKRRFNLLWARSDADACALVRQHEGRLAAVLMDIELRGSTLSGVEMTRLLKGRPLDHALPQFAQGLAPLAAPVLFLTAYTANYSERELKAAGGDRLIPKPVNFGELSLALASLELKREGTTGAELLQLARAGSLAELHALALGDAKLRARLDRFCALAEVPADSLEGKKLACLCLAALEAAPEAPEARPLVGNALRRAVVAQALSKSSFADVRGFEAFAAGLLLEVGLLTRAQHDLGGAAKVALSPASSRIIRERATGEVEHPSRGAVLLQEWGAPEAMAATVACHHHLRPPADALGRLAWLTERIAAVLESGHPARMEAEAHAAASLLGIDGATVNQVLANAPGQVAAAARELHVAADSAVRPGDALERLDDCYGELAGVLERVAAEKNELVRRLLESNQSLLERATSDALTGIANRRQLLEALKRDAARADRDGSPLSVVMVDVDHFKLVNDRHGHAVGDQVLKFVSGVLSAAVRTSDLVGRYGGEEFLVLLPRTDLGGAALVAERIRARLEHSVADAERQLKITASFGVATLMPPGAESRINSLIEAADQALYRAKAAGRNRVEADALR